MNKIFLAGVLASVILSGRGQSTGQDTPPTAPTPPAAPLRRVGIDGSMTITTNKIEAQPQLPPTGLSSGVVTNQARAVQSGSGQLRIQVFTTTDQPIATQVQQVLTAEPVLAQTLPGLNIEVNGGVVILNGEVQCGAESVLVHNLIYQKLPRVQIQNRLRLPGGAMAPAYIGR